MSKRSQLGWRLPQQMWRKFCSFTEEKWGCQGSYLRFELESAMREFIDADGKLAEAEALLRKILTATGVSSSTDSVPSQIDHSNTKKLGHRVNTDLKAEFAKLADQHYNDSYGAVLARALDAYIGGGRKQRILKNIRRLVTAGVVSGTTTDSDENTAQSKGTPDTTTGSDENPASSGGVDGTTDEAVENSELPSTPAGTTGVTVESSPPTDASSNVYPSSSNGAAETPSESVEVQPERIIELADDMPTESFPKSLLESKIKEKVGSSSKLVKEYADRVIDHLDVVEHPYKEGVYLSKEFRDSQTLWCDLNRELRITKLRRLVVYDAADSGNEQHGVTYREAQGLFEEVYSAGPSHDYAYTLMEAAGDAPGFHYKKKHGQYQLRVDVKQVRQAVINDVIDEHGVKKDLQNLSVDADLLSYTSHSGQDQEVGADD